MSDLVEEELPQKLFLCRQPKRQRLRPNGGDDAPGGNLSEAAAKPIALGAAPRLQRFNAVDLPFLDGNPKARQMGIQSLREDGTRHRPLEPRIVLDASGVLEQSPCSAGAMDKNRSQPEPSRLHRRGAAPGACTDDD